MVVTVVECGGWGANTIIMVGAMVEEVVAVLVVVAVAVIVVVVVVVVATTMVIAVMMIVVVMVATMVVVMGRWCKVSVCSCSWWGSLCFSRDKGCVK